MLYASIIVSHYNANGMMMSTQAYMPLLLDCKLLLGLPVINPEALNFTSCAPSQIASGISVRNFGH